MNYVRFSFFFPPFFLKLTFLFSTVPLSLYLSQTEGDAGIEEIWLYETAEVRDDWLSVLKSLCSK